MLDLEHAVLIDSEGSRRSSHDRNRSSRHSSSSRHKGRSHSRNSMPVSLEVEAKEWENVIYRVGQTEAPFMSLASKGLRTCPTLIGNCGTLRILDLSFNSLNVSTYSTPENSSS